MDKVYNEFELNLIEVNWNEIENGENVLSVSFSQSD